MDEKTRQVGIEILGAGADEVRDDLPATWDALRLRLFALAKSLTGIVMESGSRTTLKLATPEGVPAAIRHFAAKELHKMAAQVVQAGGEVAVTTLVLAGEHPSSAHAEITEKLRSGFSGDRALAMEETNELLAVANMNYVLAASALYCLEREVEEGVFLGFMESVMNTVGAVVQSAAGLRAGEVRPIRPHGLDGPR
jgi:hypothetical protein